jgi:hypothetical protein
LGEKKPYPFQNRMVQGESLEFEAKSEPFSHYTLEDGTQVKAKLVLLNVVKLDEYNDEGVPVYQFQLQQLIGVDAPESVKRKKQ